MHATLRRGAVCVGAGLDQWEGGLRTAHANVFSAHATARCPALRARSLWCYCGAVLHAMRLISDMTGMSVCACAGRLVLASSVFWTSLMLDARLPGCAYQMNATALEALRCRRGSGWPEWCVAHTEMERGQVCEQNLLPGLRAPCYRLSQASGAKTRCLPTLFIAGFGKAGTQAAPAKP